MQEFEHIPVLLQEAIESLHLSEGAVVVDGTMNTGGHSKAICAAIGKKGHLIGIDKDGEALAKAKENLSDAPCAVSFVEGDYRNMTEHVAGVGIKSVDAILLDIGLSSRQLDTTERGFTFQKDQPLLMTFESDSKKSVHTAYDVVNMWSEESLVDILYGFGDERYARRIARKIVETRSEQEITSTVQLADIIKDAVPHSYRAKKVHPATKTFQAIRIAVNDEFGALHEGIEKGISLLRAGGRMSIISFHSGEDRIVKRAFKKSAEAGIVAIITKRPIVPTAEEVTRNARARSSKMRVIEKI